MYIRHIWKTRDMLERPFRVPPRKAWEKDVCPFLPRLLKWFLIAPQWTGVLKHSLTNDFNLPMTLRLSILFYTCIGMNVAMRSSVKQF